MNPSKKLLPIAVALLLIGAGCSGSTNSNANTNAATDENPSSMNESAINTNESAGNENTNESTTVTTDVKIDDTWKAYANTALGFGFKTPTKGRYAPLWTVTFEKADSAKIKDGCYVADGGDTAGTSVGDTAFCRTKLRTDLSATTRYVTKIGSSYVVITFTKKVDPKTSDSFSWDDYDKQIDAAIGTYMKTK